jgi:hypothetical protein
LGTLNTAYTARGSFDGTNGIGPNTPFAYSPENTASFGVQYDIPASKGSWVVAGNYGWRDEYTRDNANQRTPIDANGNYIMEPSYGVLKLARRLYAERGQLVCDRVGHELDGRAVRQWRLRHAVRLGLRLLGHRPVARGRHRVERKLLVLQFPSLGGRSFTGGEASPRRSC